MSNVETAKLLANGQFDHALENAIGFGLDEGIRQERARIASILRCDEAQHRLGSAVILALTEKRLELWEARDILSDLPVIDAPAANVADVRACRAALRQIKFDGDRNAGFQIRNDQEVGRRKARLGRRAREGCGDRRWRGKIARH